MPAGTSSWSITGAAGSLKAGSRHAASFASWSAARQPDGRWRISAASVDPDPYWFENGSSFRAVLRVGKGELRGPAEIVTHDPLTFDMRIEGT